MNANASYFCASLLRLLVLGVCALPFAGCRHYGPQTVASDRFNYSSAVADSWKEQTLLNIVKLRYLDLPIFLDVGQIVSGYSIETSANVGGQVSSASAIQGNSFIAGASGKFTDRPTITYSPLTGDKFLRSLMEPIPPHSVFYLIQSGYAADFVLALTVDAMNGLRNQGISLSGERPPDPDFIRALALFRQLQLSSAVGMRIEKPTNDIPAAIMFFRKDNPSPDVESQAAELKKLMGYAPDQDRVKLIYSPVRSEPDDLAVQTRSMIQILMAMAAFIEVPSAHVSERRVMPSISAPADQWPIRVRCTAKKPSDFYAAVPYRGNWFWIEDTDLKSKRAFGTIMFLFTLADTGNNPGAPLITIPAQ
jgi:hypothetical protein